MCFIGDVINERTSTVLSHSYNIYSDKLLVNERMIFLGDDDMYSHIPRVTVI